MERKTTIEIDDVTYHAELATIERTHLGYEDHGIFAIGMHFAGSGWGQGDGLRGAAGPFAARYAAAVIDVLGCGTWEELPGRTVYVLRADTYGPIVGIAHPLENRSLIYGSLAEPVPA